MIRSQGFRKASVLLALIAGCSEGPQLKPRAASGSGGASSERIKAAPAVEQPMDQAKVPSISLPKDSLEKMDPILAPKPIVVLPRISII